MVIAGEPRRVLGVPRCEHLEPVGLYPRAKATSSKHRRHAVIARAIRNLKEGMELNRCPSGGFFANAAWLVLATLAHNLLRWAACIARRAVRG